MNYGDVLEQNPAVYCLSLRISGLDDEVHRYRPSCLYITLSDSSVFIPLDAVMTNRVREICSDVNINVNFHSGYRRTLDNISVWPTFLWLSS